MKIALLTDGIFPYSVGGMQKHSYYLARFLADQGVSVEVYHPTPDPDIHKLGPDFDPETRHLINLRTADFPSLPIHFPGHYLINSYRYSSNIFEQLKGRLESYDFIYAQGFAAWRLLNEKSKGLKTPPVCLNFHGLEMFQRTANLKRTVIAAMFRPWTAANLKKADFVQSLGAKLTDILLELNITRDQIWEIPIGVGKEWIYREAVRNNEVRTFAFVGRYERRKGIEELSRLLHEMVDKETFEFQFIGPIPESLQISSPKVKYWGLVKESSRVRKILQGVDVLVCPSYSEGMPTVIHEAMASGCAVIATDVGAVSLQVDSQTGWLIPVADYGSLKSTFCEAMKLPEAELIQMKNRAIEKVRQKFLWDRIVKLSLDRIQEFSPIP